MAFNLEQLKMRVSDFLHTLGAELGPWVHHLEEGFHSVAEAVHGQAVVDEHAAENVVAGAVKTVEQQVEDDVTTAAAAQTPVDAPATDETTDTEAADGATEPPASGTANTPTE